ncbi:MAG: GIY-YIG nuclease family protein [Pseudomonadota bacterium]
MKIQDIFVYMLRCWDGSYYVGLTRRPLEQRVAEHNAGALGGYTARRRPVELVWCQDFKHMDEAIETERQIKRWRRTKKEALIAGDRPVCRPWHGGGWRGEL